MKVSVIIPIFNAEDHIERCINSILTQDYENIELLLINDGSTDNSCNILKRYESNNKIKIFNNNNYGVSYSRNYGLKKATGDYIMFVDVDDILLPNSIKTLVKIAENNKEYDIIRFSGYEELRNGTLIELEDYSRMDFNNRNDLTKISCFVGTDNNIRGYVWLLFIKNKNIKLFDERLYYLEDTLFYLKNFIDKKVFFTDEKMYIYKYNKKSVTKVLNDYHKKIENMLCAYRAIKEFVEEFKYNEYKLQIWIIQLIFYRIQYIAYNCKSYKEFKFVMKQLSNNNELVDIIRMVRFKDVKRQKRLEILLYSKKLYFLLYSYYYIKNKIKN